MKCIICGQRRGKRHCPAKNSLICTQCCGEKRVVEIPCPQDCPHLLSGQSYQVVKKRFAQLSHVDDPVRRRRLFETNQHFPHVLYEMEAEVVRFTQGLRNFADSEILQAIELLTATYRTEEKGLIYEHTSSNPLVQSLFRELRKLTESHRQPSQDDVPALKRAEILDCLEALQQDIQFHLQSESDRGSYLEFIRRSHPDVHRISGLLHLP